MRFFTFTTMLDRFYISFLKKTKPRYGRKSISLSLYYICIVEIAFFVLLAVFFSAFATQLNIVKMSTEKVLIIAVLAIIFICFKNWMRFNGKRRNILNAKSKFKTIETWKLILVPMVCILMSVVFYQAI